MKKIILDVGCGRFKTPGAIGVDIIKGGEEDVQHDLNKFPYPFEENSVDEIHAYHILEHVEDFIGVVHELYRIAKPGAKIYVRAPHASCLPTSWADPTHRKFFVKHSFLHFHGENSSIYGFKTNIHVEVVRLHYYLYEGFRHGMKITNKPVWINRIINSIFNSHSVIQDLTERFLAYYLGGFEEVYYELRVVK